MTSTLLLPRRLPPLASVNAATPCTPVRALHRAAQCFMVIGALPWRGAVSQLGLGQLSKLGLQARRLWEPDDRPGCPGFDHHLAPERGHRPTRSFQLHPSSILDLGVNATLCPPPPNSTVFRGVHFGGSCTTWPAACQSLSHARFFPLLFSSFSSFSSFSLFILLVLMFSCGHLSRSHGHPFSLSFFLFLSLILSSLPPPLFRFLARAPSLSLVGARTRRHRG